MEPKFIQVGQTVEGESTRIVIFDLNDVSSVEFEGGTATVWMKSRGYGQSYRFTEADAQALWNLFRAK